jgi:hypothetical protein
MSGCTYAENDGENLIARERLSAHNDPISSDFKEQRGAEEYGDGSFLGDFYLHTNIYIPLVANGPRSGVRLTSWA